MIRRFFYGLLFVVLLVSVRTTFAYQGPSPQHSASAWEVSFWKNKNLSGEPVLTAVHDQIDWDWGTGSPNVAIPSDGFSARWERYIDFTGGAYRFTSTSDDGIRVYVDNQLIIDQWNDHAVQTHAVDKTLAAGHHLVVVIYYENSGLAKVSLNIGPVSVDSQHWRGEYFTNRYLTGLPTVVRDDPAVYFNWFYGSPAPVIGSDEFSVRWTRTITLDPGVYRFQTGIDDGVRLWVNGHLLIDQWKDQASADYSATIYLAGDVSIKMEYYENRGMAVAQLTWGPENPGPPPPVPPPSSISVIIDDNDAGFERGGSPSAWRLVNEGYNGDLTWTWNNDRPRANYNWARWYPSLQPGQYEVFVYVPDRFSTTASARYWVSHRDGYTAQVVDQSANGGRWISLGTYYFQGSRGDYVSLADVTFEPYVSRLIAFDAIRWELR
jgi:hypothetical protein